MLLGRVTYEEWAGFWPSQSGEDQPFADYMNNTPKYVVSRTLQEPLEWNNSTLIKENLTEGITGLKRQPGKDIGISGSGTLIRSLLQEALLEELRLMVHPVVVAAASASSRTAQIRRRWSFSTRRCLARASSTSPTGRRTTETSRGPGAHS